MKHPMNNSQNIILFSVELIRCGFSSIDKEQSLNMKKIKIRYTENADKNGRTLNIIPVPFELAII